MNFESENKIIIYINYERRFSSAQSSSDWKKSRPLCWWLSRLKDLVRSRLQVNTETLVFLLIEALNASNVPIYWLMYRSEEILRLTSVHTNEVMSSTVIASYFDLIPRRPPPLRHHRAFCRGAIGGIPQKRNRSVPPSEGLQQGTRQPFWKACSISDETPQVVRSWSWRDLVGYRC